MRLPETVQCEIIRIATKTDKPLRVLCQELDTEDHGLIWDIELPPIEYTPRLFERISLKFALAEGYWHAYFQFGSAPWVEIKTIW